MGSFSLKFLGICLLALIVHNIANLDTIAVWVALPPIFTKFFSSVPTLLILLEIGFYFYFRSEVKGLQWIRQCPPQSTSLTYEGRERIFYRMIGTLSVQHWGDGKDVDSFLKLWFLNTVDDVRTIRRGNILQWFSWSFFYKFPNQLSGYDQLHLESLVSRFERYVGISFPPGLDPQQKSMRLTLDVMKAIHRPLTMYCTIIIFNSISKIVLSKVFGFTRRRISGFNYWFRSAVRSPKQTQKLGSESQSQPPARDKLPIVFIHGLGQGLMHYLNFLYHIQDRDVFILELSYISSRVGENIPESTEVVEILSTILQEHNYSRAIFMGHSFGTFTVNWVIRYHPEMVHSIMVIDPVTLITCYPTTCYSFVYHEPQTFMEWVRYLVVAKELGIARVMNRQFWWQDNCMFADDLPYKTPISNLPDRCAYYSTPRSQTLHEQSKTVMSDSDSNSDQDEDEDDGNDGHDGVDVDVDVDVEADVDVDVDVNDEQVDGLSLSHHNDIKIQSITEKSSLHCSLAPLTTNTALPASDATPLPSPKAMLLSPRSHLFSTSPELQRSLLPPEDESQGESHDDNQDESHENYDESNVSNLPMDSLTTSFEMSSARIFPEKQLDVDIGVDFEVEPHTKNIHKNNVTNDLSSSSRSSSRNSSRNSSRHSTENRPSRSFSLSGRSPLYLPFTPLSSELDVFGVFGILKGDPSGKNYVASFIPETTNPGQQEEEQRQKQSQQTHRTFSQLTTDQMIVDKRKKLQEKTVTRCVESPDVTESEDQITSPFLSLPISQSDKTCLSTRKEKLKLPNNSQKATKDSLVGANQTIPLSSSMYHSKSSGQTGKKSLFYRALPDPFKIAHTTPCLPPPMNKTRSIMNTNAFSKNNTASSLLDVASLYPTASFHTQRRRMGGHDDFISLADTHHHLHLPLPRTFSRLSTTSTTQSSPIQTEYSSTLEEAYEFQNPHFAEGKASLHGFNKTNSVTLSNTKTTALSDIDVDDMGSSLERNTTSFFATQPHLSASISTASGPIPLTNSLRSSLDSTGTTYETYQNHKMLHRSMSQIKVGVFLAGQDDLLPAPRIHRYLSIFYRHRFRDALKVLGINVDTVPLEDAPTTAEEAAELDRIHSMHEGDRESVLAARATQEDLNRMLRTRVLYEPNLGHGGILFNKKARDNVMSMVRWLADEE